MFPRYWTKSGVLVEARRVVRDKAECYRVETGGFHGFLWLSHLTPVEDTAGALALFSEQ